MAVLLEPTILDNWGHTVTRQVRWYLDGQPVGTGETIVLEAAAGEHRIVAEVDGAGEDTVELTVTPAGFNFAPTPAPIRLMLSPPRR